MKVWMGRTEFGARWLWMRSSKGGSGSMRRIEGGEEQGGCGRHREEEGG